MSNTRLAAGIAAALLAGAGTARAAGECTPSRLMIVLDKSSSMNNAIGSATKWDIAVDTLDAVATGYQSSIELGLMIFPQPDECNPGAVFVEPQLGSRGAMLAALGAPPPAGGNWTPIAQTLEVAAVEPSLAGPGGTPYAVLITDGWQWCSPYDPATRFEPVDAVHSLNAAGITTYVVGFGAGVDALTLNMMAVEAGTARAGCDPSGDTPSSPDPCYYQADSPAELLAALSDVALQVSAETCDGLDNDCDGTSDDGLSQACVTACGVGAETCVGGAWTGCSAPQPAAELCDGVDNDCDGAIDPGCACTAGDTRACGDGGSEGECATGTQSCGANGTWSGCEGAVSPASESCNGLDDDCDGRVDDADDVAGGLCGPGFACEDGSCEPIDPVTPPGDDDGAASAGCACRAGADAPGPGGLLLLLGAALAIRRRRQGLR